MKCSFCGSELEPGAGFCPNCGTIISLDNEFVSPKQPEPPEQPAAEPVAPPAAPQTAEEADFAETLSGMPAYVSPRFEAYQPAQTIPEQPYAPEEDDDDPFREIMNRPRRSVCRKTPTKKRSTTPTTCMCRPAKAKKAA